MGLSDSFWGYYLKNKLSDILTRLNALRASVPRLPEGQPVSFTNREPDNSQEYLFPGSQDQDPLTFLKPEQQSSPPPQAEQIQENISYKTVPARDSDFILENQEAPAPLTIQESGSSWTSSLEAKIQRSTRHKLNDFQASLYKRFKILPVPLLDLPPHLNYDQILTVTLAVYDEHGSDCLLKITYNPDFEGYKGGRIHYFHMYNESANFIALYQNGLLSYDPEENIWPVIQEIEKRYASPDFMQYCEFKKWLKGPRYNLFGKPGSGHYGWYRIPKHWVRIYANSPDFKAPYDEHPYASPQQAAPVLLPLPDTALNAPPQTETAIYPDDDDFGRDQY